MRRSYVLLSAALLLLFPSAQGSAQPLRWSDISHETGSAAVPARGQHALTAAPDGSIYVFGGVGADGAPLDDLWRLPAGDAHWEQVETHGSQPPPLIEPHVVALADGDLLEFGGLHADRTLSNDLYRFDAETLRWTDLSASADQAGVPPRQDHGWELDPEHQIVYAFGGDGGSLGYLNDFWSYDPAADSWENRSLTSHAGAIAPRELYNLTYDGHGGLYLFGGTNPYGRLNDFWRYDVATATWYDLTAETGSHEVPGRHYYGQAADADGNFYVLGGWKTWSSDDPVSSVADDFWKFDAAARRWIHADFDATTGLLPRIPYAMLYQPRDNRLIGFGGAVPVDGHPLGERALVNETWTLGLGGAFPLLPAASPNRDPINLPPPRLLLPISR